MAVEIHILSGTRRGERIVLDGTEFRVGANSHCEILFDLRSDPSAKGRSVLLRLASDGWFIKSIGAGEVLLNQTPIAKQTQIRSGDLVRLSELGPDFSFAIVSRAAATAARAGSVSTRAREAESVVSSSARAVDEVGRAEAAAGGASSLQTPSRPTSGFFESPWKRFVWAGTAAAVILIVVGLSVQDNETEPTGQSALASETTLELEAVSVQTVTEGSELTVRLRVKTTGASAGQPVFVLIGQPPEGAKIDHRTGLFTWTPTEAHGPGEHTIRVRVSVDDAQISSVETTFRVEVREVNSPPVIRPIEEKTIDAGKELVFPVAAGDPDQPVNGRTFYVSDGPDWISVDRSSGVVRCFPPETADGRFEATVCVSDDGQPPLEDKTVVGLVVHGDPWIRVQKELRAALFIVQVEKDGFSWPHATCCGIGDHTLLTTAREVVDLARLHRQGYQIWAVGPVTGARTAVRAFSVPQAVADLPEPGDWFYVNLGLLETEEKLPKKAQLASPDDLRDLEEGQPVACFGFSHDGGKITRFDRFEPQSIPGKVYRVGTSPRLSGNFRLLELKARIPDNVYGSPILNQQGKVIAVYGKVAPHDNVGVKDLHYAAVLDPQLLQSWLDGTDVGAWITPRVPEAVSSPQPSVPNRSEMTMVSERPAVGIDLGTTYSAVAYIDDTGRPVTIPNESGDLLTPSAILVDEDEIIVGKEAVRASVMNPAAYAECFKRDIGGVAFRRTVCGQKVPPEILSALVLERLRRDAERRLGSFHKAVVTVPAFFDEGRRRMTQNAGHLAGLNVLDIINEPTAAAVAYGRDQGFLDPAGQAASEKPHRLLVYDLGGGTFDVTVLEIDGKRFRTLATDGDVRLGGKDFDKRLVDHLAQRFVDVHGADPRSDPQDTAQLWLDAQEAKHALSERTKTTVVCFHAGIRMRIEISRGEFEEMTADLVERTETTTSLVIRQASLDWRQIDRVLLVGGASRMPIIRRMLREMTGREPDCSQSPDEAVAHGAALYAGELLAQEAGSANLGCELVNVNSHSLGVVGREPETGRKQNVILIAKNTPLPARASRVFTTARADQRSIRVPVVEGESDRPQDCIALGECVVRGLPPGLSLRTKIEVEYRYAANGRISVVARVPSVRHSSHVEIERNQAPNQDDLKTWRARLLGRPEKESGRFEQATETATVDLTDRDSIRKRLDALQARVGKAALRCRVPDSLSASQQAALSAASELADALAALEEARRDTEATLHDPAALQQGATISQAETGCQQAQVRANFTALVLGRECVKNDFVPPKIEKELREISQLQQRLGRLK